MTQLTVVSHAPAPLAPVSTPPSQQPAVIYLASLAPGSRPTMRHALATLASLATGGVCTAETCPWHLLRFSHTQALRSALAARYAAKSANKMLAALRGTLKVAWRLGLTGSEDYHRAVDIKNVPGAAASQADVGRAATQGELAALLRACADGSKLGVRDAAIIAVAYAAGLRRAELAALQMASFDAEKQHLLVTGKGNKRRVVPLENGALDALTDWLAVRGTAPGSIFLRIRRGDHITQNGISPQAVRLILETRCKQASVKPLRPHDLRRSFASDLLDSGADVVVVQQLMGHASVVTTAGYDRRPSQVRRQAVSRLHVPYVRIR